MQRNCCPAPSCHHDKSTAKEGRYLSGRESRIVNRTIPRIVGLESPETPQKEAKMSRIGVEMLHFNLFSRCFLRYFRVDAQSHFFTISL